MIEFGSRGERFAVQRSFENDREPAGGGDTGEGGTVDVGRQPDPVAHRNHDVALDCDIG